MSDPATDHGLRFDLKIPIALILTVAIQTGAACLWAGGEAQRVSDLERRLDKQQGVSERLARLEAEAEATAPRSPASKLSWTGKIDERPPDPRLRLPLLAARSQQ